MTADVYQGRCIGGPYDGEWWRWDGPCFAISKDWDEAGPDVDDDVENPLGTYSWLKGQWSWHPA